MIYDYADERTSTGKTSHQDNVQWRLCRGRIAHRYILFSDTAAMEVAARAPADINEFS